MKKLYIDEILKKIGFDEEIEILGWIKSKRHHKSIIFLDIIDSTGSIGAIVKKDEMHSDVFSIATKIPPESSVKLYGRVTKTSKGEGKEIVIKKIEVIGKATLNINPHPRMNFDIFNSRYVDFTLKKRHIFLRNPKIMAVMKLKHNMLRAIREWFDKQRFIEIDTPILSQSTLYEDTSTFDVDFFGTQVFLSQCGALYLEAALPAFEKVYTIVPAFRAQPSRSPRHNPEFWHVKGQIAFFDLKDIIDFVENMIYYIASHVNKRCEQELEVLDVIIEVSKLKPPYPKISYDDALKILENKGLKLKWGKSLGADEERILSYEFETPFFITGLPRSVEPFPYSVDSLNPEVTKTADLLSPEGYGEILGVAEFIHDSDELTSRMKEVEKYSQIERYRWYLELTQYGCIPHSGFGMGIERVLRWLLKLPHVRNTFPFPRLYGRIPYP